MEFAGFDQRLTKQSEVTLWWIDNSFSVIPGICIIIVAAIVYYYPINGKRFNDILDALSKRNNGGTVDLEEFNDIYR